MGKGTKKKTANPRPIQHPVVIKEDSPEEKQPTLSVPGSNNDGVWRNLVLSAAPGCHIIHRRAGWVFGLEDFVLEDFVSDATEVSTIPDISIDPETKMLTVINKCNHSQCYFLTIGHRCVDGNGHDLEMGQWRDDQGNLHFCATFIILLEKLKVMDVCEICVEDLDTLALHSDIQRYVPRSPGSPDNGDILDLVFSSPLRSSTPCPSFLCTQGPGGCLTHFAHASTFHAIDLACPVGTPVLAVGDGTVIEVNDKHTVGGIHTCNLFKWNSIVLRLDDRGIIVEYVHIQQGSAQVKTGQHINKGHMLCRSGDVGFCPQPHLHLEAHLEWKRDAPSIPFRLLDKHGRTEIPVAGWRYEC